MIINESHVLMASNHSSVSYSRTESAEIILSSDQAESITYSKDSKYDAKTQLDMQAASYEKQRSDAIAQNTANTLRELARINKANKIKPVKTDSEDEIIIEKILRLLEEMKSRGKKHNESPHKKSKALESIKISGLSSGGNLSTNENLPSAGVTTWQRISASSSYHVESEYTTYAGSGIAKTADGREISFNVEMNMSRAFMEKSDSFKSEEFITTDPLVINLENNVAEISDKKYYFDLDADGNDEEMSFATGSSGFLALDKNNDGRINNGNELFGTKSGNGFADLAEYDEDGNGWIDETDSVYSKLKIYSKDENGNDKLISIRSAGVGAIYLGNASTEFSLKNMETNSVNGIIRSSGIYLKENGGVGTIQHVDIAV